MKKHFGIKQAVGYGLLMFMTILGAGLLMGVFFRPIIDFLGGEPADFAGHWQEAEMGRRMGVAFAISVALALLKYGRARKKERSASLPD